MNYIANCQTITKRIEDNPIFGKYAAELAEPQNTRSIYSSIGIEPKLPDSSQESIRIAFDAHRVIPKLEGLRLTWCQVEACTSSGVFFTLLALFGDRHWVSICRSGTICLREFAKPFS